MNTSNIEQQVQSRSNFVTVVAWIFIALTGFATAISILQNVMLNTVFPIDQMTMAAAGDRENVPAALLFMFEHIRWLFLSFLIASSAALTASIGLLRRKNWGRVAFIAIMTIGILWNVSSLVIQQFIFSSMPSAASEASGDFNQNFEMFTKIITVFSAIWAIGFSILFGWIIKRLLSQGIKIEFT